jgi:RasGEF domain
MTYPVNFHAKTVNFESGQSTRISQKGKTLGGQEVNQKSGSEKKPDKMSDTKDYSVVKFNELSGKYAKRELTESQFTTESKKLLDGMRNKLSDISTELKQMNKSDANYNQKSTKLFAQIKSIEMLNREITKAINSPASASPNRTPPSIPSREGRRSLLPENKAAINPASPNRTGPSIPSREGRRSLLPENKIAISLNKQIDASQAGQLKDSAKTSSLNNDGQIKQPIQTKASPLEKILTTIGANQTNSIAPEILANSYHLVATSEELFQSFSDHLKDNKLPEGQKQALMKCATVLLSGGNLDAEYKSNKKLQIAIGNFLSQAKAVAQNSSATETKIEFNGLSLAEHSQTERAAQSSNQLEVKNHASVAAKNVFKTLDNLQSEDQLNCIKDAKLWFENPTNFHTYANTSETKNLVNDFLTKAQQSGSPEVKLAAEELKKEMKNAESRFNENNNVISPIALGKERKQKIKDFSRDLLIMQANIMSKIPTAEFFEDMGKYEQKHLEKRPNFNNGVIFVNQLTNFVHDQIIGSGIEAKKAILGEKGDVTVNTADVQKNTVATAMFFLDLAETCYNNGDYTSYMTIVSAMNATSVQRIFTERKDGKITNLKAAKTVFSKLNSLQELGGFPKMEKLRAFFKTKLNKSQDKPLLFPLPQMASDLGLISAGNPSFKENGEFNLEAANVYSQQISIINKQKKSVSKISNQEPQTNFLNQISNTPFDHDDLMYESVMNLRDGKTPT